MIFNGSRRNREVKVPAQNPKHGCPDCTHERCPLCNDTGRVVVNRRMANGNSSSGVNGVVQSNKPCPNGCPPLLLRNLAWPK